MVSLNLADIMTATRPTMPREVYETPNNEVANHTEPSEESQPDTTELIE